MEEQFNTKQDLTLGEYLSATFYVTTKLKMIRRIFLIGIILGLLNAILDIGLSTESISWLVIVWKLLLLPTFLFIFFSIGITIFSVVVYKLKPQLFKDINYRFNHWGMEKSFNNTNVSIPWRNFQKYSESKNFIYLFVNDNHSYIIQKRMFNGSDELKNFRNFLAGKIERK